MTLRIAPFWGLAVAGLSLLLWLQPKASQADAPVPMANLARAIIDASNQARAANGGLPPLEIEKALMNAALGHSLEMAEMNYFAHESPTPALRAPHDRIRFASGFDTHLGENIYKVSEVDSPEQVASRCVQAWLNSPPHRKNLLDPDFNRVGLGVVRVADTYWVTQNLAYEALELERLDSDEVGGVWNVDAAFRVTDGSTSGNVFYEGKPVADWKAGADGLAKIALKLPRPGLVQIGQHSAGTTKQVINAEFPVWSDPRVFDLSAMPLLDES